MSNPPENLRTEATKVALHKADEAVNAWATLDFNPVRETRVLQKIVASVRRARKQFDSKLFFVVIFGPLKAGKSTLTNCLAGEHVSPTGFGRETTLRPSIIVQAEESGIDQYFQRDLEAENRQELFDQVADHLRGLLSTEELNQRVEKQSFPFDPVLLEEKLTKDLGRQPLLTVIRVHGGHLLRRGVAVVDMPGLDGNRTNWQDDPLHTWVVERADFFLFVQSSVAALNKDTKGFLKEVVNRSKKPPIWIIQNFIDAKYWLEADKRKAEAAQQREKALHRVMDLLELPDSKRPDNSGLNLGLAWDGIQSPQHDWLAVSQFQEFEEAISRLLLAQRAVIQERNSVNGLCKALEDSLSELSHARERLVDFQNESRRVSDKLSQCRQLVKAIDYRTIGQQNVIAEVDQLGSIALNQWRQHTETETAALKSLHNQKMKAGQVEQLLQKFAHEIAEMGDRQLFQSELLLNGYRKAAIAHAEYAEHTAVTGINSILTEINTILKEQPLPLLGKPGEPTISDLPPIINSPFAFQSVGKWPSRWFKYEGKEIEDALNHTAKHILREQEKRVNIWKETLRGKHFTVYCERRRATLEESLAFHQTEHERKIKPEMERAEAGLRIIRVLEDGLRDLRALASDARESMRAA